MDYANLTAMVNVNYSFASVVTMLLFPLLLLSCANSTEGTGAVFEGLEGELGFEDALCGDNLMAYVADGDSNLYVASVYELAVQELLNAEIENNVWIYKNEQGKVERRPAKTLNIEEYWPKLSTINWTYVNGYTCEKRKAGFALPVHDVKKKKKQAKIIYETEEDESWCMYSKYDRCKVIWIEKSGQFIKLRNGRILKRNGEPVRVRATVQMMSCR